MLAATIAWCRLFYSRKRELWRRHESRCQREGTCQAYRSALSAVGVGDGETAPTSGLVYCFAIWGYFQQQSSISTAFFNSHIFTCRLHMGLRWQISSIISTPCYRLRPVWCRSTVTWSSSYLFSSLTCSLYNSVNSRLCHHCKSYYNKIKTMIMIMKIKSDRQTTDTENSITTCKQTKHCYSFNTWFQNWLPLNFNNHWPYWDLVWHK